MKTKSLFVLVVAILAASQQVKSQVEVEAKITAVDYCEFLNATAETDPQNLFNEKMASDLTGACVTRAGAPGDFSYSVIQGKQNEAITFLSAQDAAQYCNWLSNKAAKGSSSTSTPNFNCFVDDSIKPASTDSFNSRIDFSILVDQLLKSNQFFFHLINSNAASDLVQKSSDKSTGFNNLEEDVLAVVLVAGFIVTGIEIARNNAEAVSLYTEATTCNRMAAEASANNNEPVANQWRCAADFFHRAAQARARGNQATAAADIQQALRHRWIAETGIVNNTFLVSRIADSSSRAVEARVAGNEAVALLYDQALISYRAAERNANNELLAAQQLYAANSFFKAAKAATDGNQVVAQLYTGAATCRKNVVIAITSNREDLAELWRNTANAFWKAAEATAMGKQASAVLYTQAASYDKKAAEAKTAGNEVVVIHWSNAGGASFRAAQATEDNNPQAGRYIQKAINCRNAAEAAKAAVRAGHTRENIN